MQTEKVIDHIVDWLKDYATSANINGFVLGISGGIDSAVVSAFVPKRDCAHYVWKCQFINLLTR